MGDGGAAEATCGVPTPPVPSLVVSGAEATVQLEELKQKHEDVCKQSLLLLSLYILEMTKKHQEDFTRNKTRKEQQRRVKSIAAVKE